MMNHIFHVQSSAFNCYCFRSLSKCVFLSVSVFSMKYMLSDEFWDTSIIYRHFYCGLWAHFALYKYISCWLLTEGKASIIMFIVLHIPN